MKRKEKKRKKRRKMKIAAKYFSTHKKKDIENK